MFLVLIMVEVGLKFQKTERLLAIVSNIKVRVLQTENIDISGQQKLKTKKDLVEKH